MILLSAIFSFAMQRGLRPDSPCAGVRRYKPGKSERYLSPAEQVSLGEALDAAERAGTNPNAISVIRVLALTGARAGEILGLRWPEVDFERICLRLSDSKTGAKVIPLGAAAMRVIAAQARRDRVDYVFPGAQGGPLGSIGEIWRRIRAAAGLGNVRLHDLRHSFASNIVNAGGSLPVIGALLGHRSTQTTARYAHLADDPLRAVADRAAGSIAAALAEGRAESVPIRRQPHSANLSWEDNGHTQPPLCGYVQHTRGHIAPVSGRLCAGSRPSPLISSFTRNERLALALFGAFSIGESR
jgi:integrase